MQQLSRTEIAEKYRLPEATIAALEDLPDSLLMRGELQRVVRGRITYMINEDMDRLLRAASVHYTRLPHAMPCHRALLFHFVSEANIPNACRILRDRGIVPLKLTDKQVNACWSEFLRLLPKECHPYFTGKVDKPTPLDQAVLDMLGLTELMNNPYIVADKFSWLSSSDSRVLTDAFLAAGADAATVRAYLADAYRFDVTEDGVREYKRCFFDLGITTQARAYDFTQAHDHPQYRSCVGNAVRGGKLSDVINTLQLSALVDIKRSAENSLAPARAYMGLNPSRDVGIVARRTVVKNYVELYYLMNTLEKAASAEAAANDEDILELLKLEHNATINNKQMSMKDLPKDVRDGVVTGPIKARS